MTLRCLALACALAACGDDGTTTVDAKPDPCAPQMTFTGEYIDWDSGGDPGFLGIYDATVTLQSDTSFSDITAPNGRFELCIPTADTQADVTPMAGSTYAPGVIQVEKKILAELPVLSYRSLTSDRATALGFDAAKAHVFVQIVGGTRTVTTSPAPGIAQVNDGTAWTDGNAGSTIYLGNLDATGNVTLEISGGDILGTKTVPVTAGAFTYVTFIAK